MTLPSDRRLEPRLSVDLRGIVIASGFEMPCRILDRSASGLKIRLDRTMALTRPVMVIDIAAGVATDVDVAWIKGSDAGLKVRSQASLRGLVPARLAMARDIWRRAGGR